MLQREQRVMQRRADVADVEPAGRGRGKAGYDGHAPQPLSLAVRQWLAPGEGNIAAVARQRRLAALLVENGNGGAVDGVKRPFLVEGRQVPAIGAGARTRSKADDVKLICSNPKCGNKWWYSKEKTIYCPRCGHPGG